MTPRLRRAFPVGMPDETVTAVGFIGRGGGRNTGAGALVSPEFRQRVRHWQDVVAAVIPGSVEPHLMNGRANASANGIRMTDGSELKFDWVLTNWNAFDPHEAMGLFPADGATFDWLSGA